MSEALVMTLVCRYAYEERRYHVEAEHNVRNSQDHAARNHEDQGNNDADEIPPPRQLS